MEAFTSYGLEFANSNVNGFIGIRCSELCDPIEFAAMSVANQYEIGRCDRAHDLLNG